MCSGRRSPPRAASGFRLKYRPCSGPRRAASLGEREKEMAFSIRVVDSDGEPRKSARVGVRRITLLGGAKSQYTDEDGWAEFDWPDLPATFIISVNGVDAGEYALDDGDTESFTV
jgi:hypothetical protein